MSRLYFAVRTDLSEGRRMAQALHAMNCWVSKHGPHDGTVIVYGVPDETALLQLWERIEGILWREPDFDDEATALATQDGPHDLPLLGRHRKRRMVPPAPRRYEHGHQRADL